jgi:hypothetical protein
MYSLQVINFSSISEQLFYLRAQYLNKIKTASRYSQHRANKRGPEFRTRKQLDSLELNTEKIQ